MNARVRMMTRRIRLPNSDRFRTETLILRDRDVVAVVPEGDPLGYLLGLSPEELRRTRDSLAPAFKDRPEVRDTMDAILEYKETTEGERLLDE